MVIVLPRTNRTQGGRRATEGRAEHHQEVSKEKRNSGNASRLPSLDPRTNWFSSRRDGKRFERKPIY